MRALILGASGLLGHTLYRRWSARKDWEVFGTYHSFPVPGLRFLDLKEEKAAADLISETAPDAVVVPASNPFVDYLEAHESEARKLNVDATLCAARTALEAGRRVLFFSTDYVFDGGKGGYRESDEPAPLNVYGRQKLEVERTLLGEGEGAGALVCRVAGLFGWEFRPRNFVHQVLKRLDAGEEVRAVDDQIYTPTYVEDIAEAAARLLEAGHGGLFHLAGPESVTREGFARKIAEVFERDPSRIRPVPTSAVARPGGARRPADSSLDSSKARETTGLSFGNVVESLKDMRDSRKEWDAYAAKAGIGA